MKIFSLKKVVDKIKVIMFNRYNSLLNKIAFKSRAYKDLHNRYNSFLVTHKHIQNIDCVLNNTKIIKLIDQLMFQIPGAMSTLGSFDTYFIRASELNDVIIVEDILEEFRVKEEMKYFSGAGQVFTLDDFIEGKPKIRIPINRVYISSSIWLKDMITIRNLIYIIENEKKGIKL